MGDSARACGIAEQLADGPMQQRIIFTIFNKCGNCKFRIRDMRELIDPEKRAGIAYAPMFACKGSRKLNNVVSPDAKQLAKLIRDKCALCERIHQCVAAAVQSVTLIDVIATTSKSPRAHLERVEACAACPEFEACVQEALDVMLTGGKWSLAKRAIIVFSKCKYAEANDGD